MIDYLITGFEIFAILAVLYGIYTAIFGSDFDDPDQNYPDDY